MAKNGAWGKSLHAEERIGLLFILPNYLIYFIFVLLPVIWVIYLGFTNYNLLDSPRWVWFANYQKLCTDEVFKIGLINTFYFSICTILPSIAIGLVIAVLLNHRLIKGRAMLRAAYFLPNIISMVAASMVWLWIYDPGHGLLNNVLAALHLPQRDWLFDLGLALPSIVILSIWNGLGYNMIVYLAGLQGIPYDIYEAATVDGASQIQQFMRITIPMLRPITFFLFVMACIKSFQVFDQVFIMTNGGPANATTTIVHRIYENAFLFNKMGYASSIAVSLLLITSIVTLINFKYGHQDVDS